MKLVKYFFSALVVKEVKAERVEHCVDTQSSCLVSQVHTSPNCLPAKMYHGNFFLLYTIHSKKVN